MSLANLESLSLWSNQLPIPAELGDLANLEVLFLENNRLKGEIPSELGGLTNLRLLGLYFNQLTGEIPAELGGLANLKSLSLAYNQFTGEIPAELGGLTILRELYLSSNQFTGEIPSELGGLPKLERLELGDNMLTGKIPAELGGLPKLERLSLGGNMLIGEILAELGGLANLIVLDLHFNRLIGEIPAELGDLLKLERLSLQGNQLSGCLPQALRGVSSNDLHVLALPYCDVLLSGLTIIPGSLFPSFDPYHTEYTVAVGLSRVTVVPANGHNASILFVDENDNEIMDADNRLAGRQVDFSPDFPSFKIRVVSEDSLASHTYTISDLGIRYDANENGVIDRDEAVAAIIDYFDDRITRVETIAVIRLYFST